MAVKWSVKMIGLKCRDINGRCPKSPCTMLSVLGIKAAFSGCLRNEVRDAEGNLWVISDIWCYFLQPVLLIWRMFWFWQPSAGRSTKSGKGREYITGNKTGNRFGGTAMRPAYVGQRSRIILCFWCVLHINYLDELIFCLDSCWPCRAGAMCCLCFQEAWLNTLVGAEIMFCFFMGEVIGRGSLVGYYIPGAVHYEAGIWLPLPCCIPVDVCVSWV